MLKEAEFYQSHLDRVSRSFAFCIRQLPEPLRGWVALSYLLCRILDTIEDSPWASQEARFQTFDLFDRALLSDQGPSLEGWAKDFPSGVNAHERALLVDAEVILQDLHALPVAVRDLISGLVHSMSLGMQHFAKQNGAGDLQLKTLNEVNQYCFFVAGLVGELLAKLLAKVEPRFQVNEGSVVRAHHFGLFLQKVNLLKDQVVDENSGRHLIPSRELVEKSAEQNANRAFEFLLQLPPEQIEFRRFCAWSLFLGLEAVSASRPSKVAQSVIKVSREKATEIVAAVEVALADESMMQSLFSAALEKLGWRRETANLIPPTRVPDWLLGFYRGRLKPPALLELGLSS